MPQPGDLGSRATLTPVSRLGEIGLAHEGEATMKLTGLHILLTYECNFECDHCFVWSGPFRTGTLTVPQVEDVLRQARSVGTVDWIYFEGGEPFLYYGTLRLGVRRAVEMGFKVGIVSNAYWATTPEDAEEWLRDFKGSVSDLSLSCDRFHGDDEQVRHVRFAKEAARKLGIPVGAIEIAGEEAAARVVGQLPEDESGVMYRGRAAAKLAPAARKRPPSGMTECPYEDLREPGRVHLDPFGNLHICQGIVMGNLFSTPLREICEAWDPDAHPIAGPLLAGGPVELARRHGIPTTDGYADACHLCYETRTALRSRFPVELGPAQMYGEVG
jgi:organic radical activating enzyme